MKIRNIIPTKYLSCRYLFSSGERGTIDIPYGKDGIPDRRALDWPYFKDAKILSEITRWRWMNISKH